MISSTSATVSTVTGQVPADALGVTLPHEHVIHRISLYSGKADNVFDDVEMMVEELARFKAAGGGTVCDVTPIGVGRDPRALREVSRKSGVTIISGVGLYMADVLPQEVSGLSASALADYLVGQIEGDDCGVRAGMIGEIASHNEGDPDWQSYRLTEQEERIFRAAAKAQRRTGLCISTHASLGRGGVAQLRTLLQAGAEPQRIIIGHCDAHSHLDVEDEMRYYHTLLDEGASIQFDLFGWEELIPDNDRFDRVARLVSEGFADRILLSTDTCRRSQLHRFGGRGFDYLFNVVLPGLREHGVLEGQIHQMTVVNPANVLAAN